MLDLYLWTLHFSKGDTWSCFFLLSDLLAFAVRLPFFLHIYGVCRWNSLRLASTRRRWTRCSTRRSRCPTRRCWRLRGAAPTAAPTARRTRAARWGSACVAFTSRDTAPTTSGRWDTSGAEQTGTRLLLREIQLTCASVVIIMPLKTHTTVNPNITESTVNSTWESQQDKTVCLDLSGVAGVLF